MDNSKKRPTSDAEWYCQKDPERERFYENFSRCVGSMECDGVRRRKRSKHSLKR